MLIAVSLTLLVLALLYLYFMLVGIKFIGVRSNPFGLFFGINFFVFSLPGIIFVYSPSLDTLLNSGIMSVSSSTIEYVTYAYFLSLLILMIMVFVASYVFRGFHVRKNCVSTIAQKNAVSRFIVISLWLNASFILVLFQKIGINNIPLIESIRGDLGASHVLKAKLITGEISKLPESVNQLFRILIPLTAYLSMDQCFSNNTMRKNKIVLFLSVIIAFIYFSYELQKAPVFIFIFGLIFIYSFHRGLKWKVMLSLPILLVALLGVNAFYFNITDLEDIMVLVEKVATRLFIMQNQGMYYIVEHISPNANYAKNGAILSSFIFSDMPRRADSVVMEIMYGYAEGNVNMNTYFLGQAYSIAGTVGIILGPFVIGSHLCLYLVIFKKLYKKNIDFFMPISIVFYLFFVPINQGFNSFLYGRNVIFFVVFGFIIYCLYLLQTKNLFKKASFKGLSNES
ncbi:hypothetical protein N8222_02065 [Oceanospirillaceae bacterium]|nr:hypothetical protein [Oceanospirillaceae bacterium]